MDPFNLEDPVSNSPIVPMDDRGALLTATAWFLACTLLFCLVIRLVVRHATQRLPNTDDLLLIAAAVLAIGSTIATSCAVQAGLGKRSHLLTGPQISEVQKAMYAATILYVLTVGLSKISIALFLSRLANGRPHKIAVWILGVVIITWTIAVTAGVVFQCQLPKPWELFTGKCVPMLPFWIASSSVDMLTDLAMILLPLHIMWHLQLETRKKIVVVLLFSIRLILIITSIIRLAFIKRLMTADPAYDSIPYAITTQCQSNLSVIVACSPALRPFMDSIRTGTLSMRLAQRVTGTNFGCDKPIKQTMEEALDTGPSTKRARKASRTTEPRISRKKTPDIPRPSIERDSYTQKAYGKVISQPMTSANTTVPTFSPTRSPPQPPHPPSSHFVSSAHLPKYYIENLSRGIHSADSSRAHALPRPTPPPMQPRLIPPTYIFPPHPRQSQQTHSEASIPVFPSRIHPHTLPQSQNNSYDEARPDLTTPMEQMRTAYIENNQPPDNEGARETSTRTRSPPRPPPPPEDLRPRLSAFISRAGWVRRESVYGQWKRNDRAGAGVGQHMGK